MIYITILYRNNLKIILLSCTCQYAICLPGVYGAPGIPGVYIDTVYPVMEDSPSDLRCVATNITDFTPTILTWWRLETPGGPEPINTGSNIMPGGILPLDYTFTRDDQDVVFYCVAEPSDRSCGTKLESAWLTMDVLRE